MRGNLKIGVIAPPWIPVPPKTYGGTELITDILCRGFKDAGHHPVLFVSRDSTCPVERAGSTGQASLPPDKYKEHLHLASALKALRSLDLDIIHSHLEGMQPYAELINIPVVCTFHVDVTEQRRSFFEQNKRIHYVAISENQAGSFPYTTDVIHHGIELDRYPPAKKKDSYLAFLGEISRRKGADTAVRTWMTLAVPVKIAGYVPPTEERWFKRSVMPRLKPGILEHLGPVEFPKKIGLLSKAAALLCPVRWEEPFGLVAVEAMACGTPVIAMRRGAFPELIEDGVTGFLCDTEDDIFEAVAKAKDIDPEACRQRAERLFDSSRMVADYLALFARLVSRDGPEKI